MRTVLGTQSALLDCVKFRSAYVCIQLMQTILKHLRINDLSHRTTEFVIHRRTLIDARSSSKTHHLHRLSEGNLSAFLIGPCTHLYTYKLFWCSICPSPFTFLLFPFLPSPFHPPSFRHDCSGPEALAGHFWPEDGHSLQQFVCFIDLHTELPAERGKGTQFMCERQRTFLRPFVMSNRVNNQSIAFS